MIPNTNAFIGKTEVEAEELANQIGRKLYIALRDGVPATILRREDGEQVVKVEVVNGTVATANFLA